MSKIMNSIRLMRWHLEYTVPRIMRNPTVYPEIPIPFYRESVDLVLKAHKLFPSFQTVGWDVAVTPDGPLLLEGNHNWDMEMLQIVHHKRATARFREVYGK